MTIIYRITNALRRAVRRHPLNALGDILIAALVCLFLGTAVQAADPAPRSFDIPAQSLEGALIAFGTQSGIEVLFNSDTSKDLRSPGVSGTHIPDQALRRLLAGTGLTAKVTSTGAVTIERPIIDPLRELVARAKEPLRLTEAETKPKAPVRKSEDGPTVQPEMTVTASPYDETSYNAPVASTATKTETPIMETPLNIQVIPQQVLRDQQVVRIDKALQNVSGVTPLTGGIQKSFFVRGFNAIYYRNGIQVSQSLIDNSFAETANLERIEVLKGPASILFGRIEPGGLINLVTKQPLSTPYYALEQQFGSFDFYRTTVDATGPITPDDTLGYRFNLAYENSGSFREFIESERVFLNPVLRWKLSEHTRADLWVQYTHTDDPFDTGIPYLGNRPAPVPRERFLGERDPTFELDNTRVGFDWSHAFDDRWTLRHTFETVLDSHTQLPGVFPASPPDPARCSAQNCPVDRFFFDSPTNEADAYYTALNLTGKFDTWGLAHTLLLGGDYWRQESSATSRLVFSAPSIDLFNPVHTGVPSGVLDTARLSIGDQSEEWYGFYVQDQVKLPFNVHVLAGFRYDDARQSSLFGTDSFKSDDSAVTPRFGLLWQPLPALSLYGNYVENFGRANVFSAPAGGTAPPPETAQQWEIGAKTELFDGRLSATLAWFDLTKQNIATPDPDPARALAGIFVTTGEVRNRGLELDIAGELWPGVNAIASYAYIDSEITKDRQAIFNDDFTAVIGFNDGNQGNRFQGVPRHGGSFWMTYEPQALGWRGLKLGAGVVTRSQQQGSNQNIFQVPGYAVVNLLAGYGWKVGPSKVSLQLNVDNLLDKEYFNTGGTFITAAFPGAPRTFLGSVRVEW